MPRASDCRLPMTDVPMADGRWTSARSSGARSAAATIHRCSKRCIRTKDSATSARISGRCLSPRAIAIAIGTSRHRHRSPIAAALRHARPADPPLRPAPRRSRHARRDRRAECVWLRSPHRAVASRAGGATRGRAVRRATTDRIRTPTSEPPTSDLRPRPASPLKPMTVPERLLADYAGTSLTIGPHPMSLRRPELALRGVLRASDLPAGRHGRRVRVAGAVITRQRPGHREGVRLPHARGRDRHRQHHRPARSLLRAAGDHRRGAVPARRRHAADPGRGDVGQGGAATLSGWKFACKSTRTISVT